MPIERPERLAIVDRNAGVVLAKWHIELVSLLRGRGIEAHWTRDPATVHADEIIVTHDPIDASTFPANTCILGQRFLNRQERLRLADRLGVPVATWAAPTKNEVALLFDEWSSTSIVYKSDSSFRRKGVRLVTREDLDGILAQYNPASDVFMRLLEFDPITYKVDIFFSEIVGCRALPTYHISHPDFHKPTPPSWLHPLPSDVTGVCQKLGKAFLLHGAGYISVDLMRTQDAYLIIEINSCGVGRMNTWRIWPDVYIPNYAEALQRWFSESWCRPTLSEVTQRCSLLRK